MVDQMVEKWECQMVDKLVVLKGYHLVVMTVDKKVAKEYWRVAQTAAEKADLMVSLMVAMMAV